MRRYFRPATSGHGITFVIVAVVVGMIAAFLLAIPGVHLSDLLP